MGWALAKAPLVVPCGPIMSETDGPVRQAMDLGTSGGQWRFKEGGMVFGPVPARLLLEKLYAGEIGPETPIAREEEEGFRPLREVGFFTLHVAKAGAKLRVERDEGAIDEALRRRRLGRLAVSLGVVTSALGLAGGGAAFLVLRRQQRLKREVDDIVIASNPPTLSEAARPKSTEDEVDVPSALAHLAHRANPGAAMAGAATPAGEVAQVRYDKGSIIAAEVRQKGALIPCIKAELSRAPSFRGAIHFSVAIGNEGRVAKLWMDDPSFKDGPLQGCFWNAMSAWRFTPYEGERATLSDSFQVGP